MLYAEPGGYYELGLQPTKPIVACVVGRWKAKLTRAVGHAGAMAGSGDDAASKERWFMEMFGVDDLFIPRDPVCSAKGRWSPTSPTSRPCHEVMALNGVEPDFAPKGDLSLKAWFGNNQGLALPPELDLPVVEATPPYDAQIKELQRQVGAVFIRQSMKDASGATVMDPATQVTSLHGVDAGRGQEPFEANLCLAVLRELNGPNDNKLANVAIAAHVNLHGDPILAAADAARAPATRPTPCSRRPPALGRPSRAPGGDRDAARAVPGQGQGPARRAADRRQVRPSLAVGAAPDPKAAALLAAVEARGARSVFVRYLRTLEGHVTADAVLAALALTLAWGPLQRKRISRRTAEPALALALYGTLLGRGARRAARAGQLLRRARRRAPWPWTATELAGSWSTGRRPGRTSCSPTRSCWASCSPTAPARSRPRAPRGRSRPTAPRPRAGAATGATALLSHTGFSHGGNGFEGIQLLLDAFAGQRPRDPGDPNHGLDLAAMAKEFALAYRQEKAQRRETAAEGAPSRASTTRCSAASRSTPTCARRSWPR